MARSLTLALAFWSSSMEVASFAIAPGARPQFNNVRCAPVAASAAPATALTVGEVKVAFNEALGKAMKLNPRFIQIPMAAQSFVNEMLTSTTLAMVTPSYQYTRIFAVGYEDLCDLFLSAGIEEDTAVYVRESMCTALGLDPAKVKADAAALKAASAGKSEEEVLALDDLKALAGQKTAYSYTFGAGLILLMKQANVDPTTAIEKWSDELNLNCKGVLSRDYGYFKNNVEKFEGMKEMFAQMKKASENGKKKRTSEIDLLGKTAGERPEASDDRQVLADAKAE